jgi:hypothetical protein
MPGTGPQGSKENGLGEDDGSQTEAEVMIDGRGQLVPMAPGGGAGLVSEAPAVPAIVAIGGERAIWRFVEFFTANIRNGNTRAAYHRAVTTFCRWCEHHELHELGAIRTHHVAAYVEELGRVRSKAHRQATPRRHPHALRLARGAGVDWGGGAAAARRHPHRSSKFIQPRKTLSIARCRQTNAPPVSDRHRT